MYEYVCICLQRDAPQRVKTGTGVYDAIRVRGHEIDNFAGGKGRIQYRTAHRQSFSIDSGHQGGANFQSYQRHQKVEVRVEECT